MRGPGIQPEILCFGRIPGGRIRALRVTVPHTHTHIHTQTHAHTGAYTLIHGHIRSRNRLLSQLLLAPVGVPNLLAPVRNGACTRGRILMASETRPSREHGRRLNPQRKRQRAGYIRGRGIPCCRDGKEWERRGNTPLTIVCMGSALKASVPLHEPMRIRTHRTYWLGPLTKEKSRMTFHNQAGQIPPISLWKREAF